MTYNIKTGKEKILSIWITIIRHDGSGHEVLSSSFLAATFRHYLSRGVLPRRLIYRDMSLDGVAFIMGSHFQQSY